jgi:hypothetical protein
MLTDANALGFLFSFVAGGRIVSLIHLRKVRLFVTTAHAA